SKAGDQSGLARRTHCVPLTLSGRVGAHEPRRDTVDRDAERTQLVRELAREPDLAGLGAGIGLDAGEAHAEAGAAGDVDDPAPALPLHAGYDGLRAEEGTGEIDLENGVPVGFGDLLDWPADLPANSPGIVDQDIDAAGFADQSLDRRAIS